MPPSDPDQWVLCPSSTDPLVLPRVPKSAPHFPLSWHPALPSSVRFHPQILAWEFIKNSLLFWIWLLPDPQGRHPVPQETSRSILVDLEHSLSLTHIRTDVPKSTLQTVKDQTKVLSLPSESRILERDPRDRNPLTCRGKGLNSLHHPKAFMKHLFATRCCPRSSFTPLGL